MVVCQIVWLELHCDRQRLSEIATDRSGCESSVAVYPLEATATSTIALMLIISIMLLDAGNSGAVFQRSRALRRPDKQADNVYDVVGVM